MDTAATTYFTLTAVFLGAMTVFGLGLLFVRAARMERNVLVGSLTVVTTVIAGFILRSFSGTSNEFTGAHMVSLMLLSVFGFGVAWLYDRIMGPKPLASRDDREATLGAELAD